MEHGFILKVLAKLRYGEDISEMFELKRKKRGVRIWNSNPVQCKGRKLKHGGNQRLIINFIHP